MEKTHKILIISVLLVFSVIGVTVFLSSGEAEVEMIEINQEDIIEEELIEMDVEDEDLPDEEPTLEVEEPKRILKMDMNNQPSSSCESGITKCTSSGCEIVC